MRKIDSIAVAPDTSSRTDRGELRVTGPTSQFLNVGRAEVESGMPLGHYLFVLKRNRWRLLAFIAVSVITTLIISKRLTPLYASTATIEVDREMNADVVGGGSQASSEIDSEAMQAYLATQERLIQSDAVLRPVVQKYGLNAGLVKALDKDKQLASRVQDAPTALKDLVVTQPPHTFILQISYQSTDPKIAADVANDVSASYIRHSYEIRSQAASQLTEYMERQLTELKAKMERSASALAVFEKDLDVIDPEDKSSVSAARLLQLNADLTAAEADRASREAAYNAVKSGSIDAAESSEHGEQLRVLLAKLNEAQQRIADVKNQFGPEYPAYKKAASAVVELQRQVDASTSSVVQQAAVSYHQAADREALLQKSVGQAKSEFDQMNSKSFEFKALKQEADTDKQLYEELIKKIREAGINASFQSSPARLADMARPALYPSFPRTRLNLLIAFLGSTLIGMSVLFLSDSLRTTVFDPEMLRRETGLPQLPALPLTTVPSRLLPMRETGPNGEVLAMPLGYSSSKSPLTAYYEAVRSLRSAILLSGGFDEPPRSILVTSGSPSEGKTSIAMHLAAADSLQNRKTLLIDGDLRRPGVRMDLNRGIGLSDVVNGTMHWKEVIQSPAGYPNLSVIMAGPASRLVVDRVSSTVRRILEEAEREYDLVIVDSPPVLPFAEPIEFATMTDGVLLVVRAGQTQRNQVATAIAKLRNVKANLLGIVLNGISADMSSSYYYYSPKYYGEYDSPRPE
jgi:capsular exopolysaccharide synthesis family protein